MAYFFCRGDLCTGIGGDGWRGNDESMFHIELERNWIPRLAEKMLAFMGEGKGYFWYALYETFSLHLWEIQLFFSYILCSTGNKEMLLSFMFVLISFLDFFGPLCRTHV